MKKYVHFDSSGDTSSPSLDGSRSQPAGKPALRLADSSTDLAPIAPRKPLKISTVSHTLDAEVAERLRHFAFRERISESAVIEFGLRRLFVEGDDTELGRRLREAGAALRRRS